MGVYRRVYPGLTSKNNNNNYGNMHICHLFTSKTWLEHKGPHSKRLATIAKTLFVSFLCQKWRGNGQQ